MVFNNGLCFRWHWESQCPTQWKQSINVSKNRNMDVSQIVRTHNRRLICHLVAMRSTICHMTIANTTAVKCRPKTNKGLDKHLMKKVKLQHFLHFPVNSNDKRPFGISVFGCQNTKCKKKKKTRAEFSVDCCENDSADAQKSQRRHMLTVQPGRWVIKECK